MLPVGQKELQVSSSCNVTNQLLFSRCDPAAEPRVHGARGTRVSLPLRIGCFIPNRSQTGKNLTGSMGREEADGEPNGSRLQLGSIEEIEANHTVYFYTPE
ncbi:hypothetical protein F2P81_021443 [Scophthalmus maximus]|uniref:Uncharacterized protein n=1 Tax=Scophthalmus maximus TaxID=52904 RepID=A0A6A4RVD6_SCOMX|nr:hypothetical protein F2P81_021443 [Scophthalmus maximus]